jgi:hypothetical protein
MSASMTSDGFTVDVPVSTLLRWSPFAHNVWWELERPITRFEVFEALRDGRLYAEPYREPEPWTAGRARHIERIAFLVANPTNVPIDFEANPFASLWPIVDGNHRLAAAIFSGRRLLPVSVGGFIDYAQHELGVTLRGH